MSDPSGGTAWTPGSYAVPDEPSPEDGDALVEAAAPVAYSEPVDVDAPAPEAAAPPVPSMAPPDEAEADAGPALQAEQPAQQPSQPAQPAPVVMQPAPAPAAAVPAAPAPAAQVPAAPVSAAPSTAAPQPLPPPLRPPRPAAAPPPIVAPLPAQPQPAATQAGPQPLPPPLRPPPPPTAGPLPERAYASAQTPPPMAPLPAAAPAVVSGGGSRIDVINRDGWRKEFALRRTLAYVGSQPGSDIYLPQPDVAPRHVQFLPSPINRAGYRAINFSNAPLALRLSSGELRTVPPRGAAEIADGDAVELAGYSLIFHSGEVQSAAIQARIDLVGTRLEVARPLDGALYIRNAGDKAGVQFEVSPQGFDESFLQIEPGPILFPGVEKRVGFRIAHPRRATPAAGDHTIKFVITAPDVYPGESAVVSALITIAPFYAHSVRFISVVPEMSLYTLR